MNVSSELKLSDFSRGGERYEDLVTLISDTASVHPSSVHIISGDDEYDNFQALTRRHEGNLRLAYEIYDLDEIDTLSSLDMLSLFTSEDGQDINLTHSNVSISNRTVYESTIDAEDVKLSLENECCCQDKPAGFCTSREDKKGVNSIVQDRCCRCCWLFDTSRVHHIDLLDILRDSIRIVKPWKNMSIIENVTNTTLLWNGTHNVTVNFEGGEEEEEEEEEYMTFDFYDFGKNYASMSGPRYARSLDRMIIGKGSFRLGPIESRYKDPDNNENNIWMPSSVDRVKAQEWKYNYLDGNIADNPLHPTLPDKLIGPSFIAQSRRAKYVAVSKLTSDFLDTTGVIRTYEGDLENDNDLISLISSEGQLGFERSSAEQLGWSTDDQIRPYGFTHAPDGVNFQELGPGRVDTTQPLRVYGDMGPFHFTTASDWFDRFHQYRVEKNDRSRDPVNYKNELTDGHT